MTRLLLVDGKDENLHSLRSLLESHNYAVDVARHGGEALVLARRQPPHLVISDLLMPIMDGYKLLRHWKSDEQLRQIPFVVHTETYTEPRGERLALDLGADAFILKPTEPAPFVAQIQEILAKKASGRQSPLPAPVTEDPRLLMEIDAVLSRRLEERALRLEQANRELAAREARLRSIFESEPVCAMLLAADGSIIEINPAGLRMIEAESLEQVENCCLYPLVAHEFREAFRQLVARAFRGESGKLELQIVCFNGRKRWLETHASPLGEPGRPVSTVLAISSDMSERKLAGQALLESEQRFREMLALVEMLAVTLDCAGRITFCNDYLLHLTGWRMEDVLGQDWFAVFVPPEQKVRQRFHQHIAKEAISRKYENDILTRAGQRRTVAWSNTMLRDVDGRVIGTASLGVDITERKQAEESRRSAERSFRSVVENALDGIFQTSPDGRFITANPALARIYGYDSTDEILANLTDVARQLYVDPARRLEYQRQIESTGSVTSFEFQIRRKDGSVRWVSESSRAVHDEDGRIIFYEGTVEDITDRKQAEDLLRESADRLRLAVQASNVGLWDWNLQTNQVILSREWKSQLGYEEHEIENEFYEWERRVHPDDLAPTLERVNDYLARLQGVHEAEFRMRHKDGSWRWIYARGEVPPDSNGKPTRMLGCHLDITQRKHAEEAVRLSERRMATLFRASPSAICINTVAEGRLLEVNDRYCEFFGYTREEMLGRTIFELDMWVNPELRPPVILCLRRDGFVSDLEVQLRAKCGQARDALLSMALVELSGESEPVLISMFIDITDRKLAEASLRHSEERFRELAESIQEVFWITTPAKDRVLYVSPAFEKTWGRTCQRLYEEPSTWQDAIHPEDRQRVLQETTSGKRDGAYDEEYRILRPDGDIRWIRDQAFPVRGPDGRIERIVGVAQDVTDRKSAEEQLRQAQKMEAIGQLAGGVAHDFNNLLTIISGYSEMLLASSQASDLNRDALKAIHDASARAASLTRQLLAFSRQTVLQPTILDLNQVVAETEKMLRRLIGEDILLTTLLDPRISSTMVDPSQIAQVLINLAVNARDAMPLGGQLTIETRNVRIDYDYLISHPRAKPGNYVMMAISDNGSGMTPEVKAHIFEPFFTTKEVGKGTGLGLATVYGIVEQAGGQIEVYSEVGHGTVFKLFFPAIDTPASASNVEPALEPFNMGCETVLVVENEASVRGLAELAMRTQGYNVLVASDGMDALLVAEGHDGPIDMLITDVVMPRMSGREVAESLQSRYPSMKILFVSGYTDDAIVRHGLLQSEVAFLQKPYTRLTLAKKVREVLDGK